MRQETTVMSARRLQVTVWLCVGNGRFADNHFPRQTYPQDFSRTITFQDKTFPGRLRALTRRLFPVQDVSPDNHFPGQTFPDNLHK